MKWQRERGKNLADQMSEFLKNFGDKFDHGRSSEFGALDHFFVIDFNYFIVSWIAEICY